MMIDLEDVIILLSLFLPFLRNANIRSVSPFVWGYPSQWTLEVSG